MKVKRSVFISIAFLLLGFLHLMIAADIIHEDIQDNIHDNTHDDYQYIFRHLSTEQGLSQDSVNSILQDQTGFLWIATTHGLNRYDGYDFKRYFHHPDKPDSLSDDWVRAIGVDKEGFIWIGTNVRLDRLNPKTNRIDHFEHDPEKPSSISNNYARVMFRDSHGNMWIGTIDGLNKYDPVSRGFIRYYPYIGDSKSKYWNSITHITEDYAGNLLVICRAELYLFNAEANRFVSFREKFPLNLMEKERMLVFFRDSKGICWIGTKKDGLGRFDPQTGQLRFYRHDTKDKNSISENTIISIHETKAGELWIATEHSGINLFDPDNDRFIHFIHSSTNPNSLGGNYITSIIEDRSGILWVGTYGHGLTGIIKKKKFFKTYVREKSNPKSLSNQSVFAIYEDSNDDFWVGSQMGLDRLNKQTGRFQYYQSDPKDSETLSNNTVNSLCEDHQNRLWVGTRNGLNRLVRESGTFVRYFNDPQIKNSISNNRILGIIRSTVESDVMWVATAGGLNKYSCRTDAFSRYRHRADDPNSIRSDFVYTLLEDRSGTLWAGTFGGGLNKFNRETGHFTSFRCDVDDPYSISHSDVLSLLESSDGVLWVGTKYGLNRMDNKTNRFRHYFEENGLCNNLIYSIQEDDKGNLWLSTNRGLAMLDPVTDTFRNYSTADGLLNNEFNSGASFESRSGWMYFGGIQGLIAFLPGKTEKNVFIPPVVFTDFQIADYSSHSGSPDPVFSDINYSNGITLPHQSNRFSFEFSALDFRNPAKNQYAYKMDGYDDNWVYCGNRRFAAYSNLDPGDYVFKVKGTNNDGIWNNTPASVSIRIVPPFWRTLWFELLLVLVVLGGIFLYFWGRTNKIRRQMAQKTQQQLNVQRIELEKESLKKELKLKADFTAMLVHDLRNPLSAISGYSEMMMDDSGNMDIAKTSEIIKRSSKRMMTLINEMLDLSKFEAGKMSLNKSNVRLKGIVEEIVEVMHPLFKARRLKVDYFFDIPGNLRADGEKLAQVIHNLISNAYKFSPDEGLVTLRLETVSRGEDNFLLFSVEDQGPGIALEKRKHLFDKYAQLHKDVKQKGTGLGLAVSRLIVEAHGGRIGCRDGRDGGSMFYFELPIGTSETKT